MKKGMIGPLRERVTFKAPVAALDGQGGTEDGWSAGFTRWAGYTRLRGGEQVIASRLAGVQPTVIRVRADSQTLTIDSDWKAVDVHSGEEFAIRSIVRTDDRLFLDIAAESGVIP